MKQLFFERRVELSLDALWPRAPIASASRASAIWLPLRLPIKKFRERNMKQIQSQSVTGRPNKMAKQAKRQRPEDDEEEAEDVPLPSLSDNEQPPPSKKARKETNASARRSLFVRSLAATATTDALTELFSQNYPLKHATVVIDPATKQSKGYGFVTFADAEDAQRALDEFNGQSFKGRKMKIEIAQPRSREVGAKEGVEGRAKSTISAEAAALKKAREEKMAEARKPPKLIVRNLPWSIKTPEQLSDLFRKFGKVKHSTLPKVKDTQAGFGFVVMRGRKNAEKALAAVNGNIVDGRELAVDWAVIRRSGKLSKRLLPPVMRMGVIKNPRVVLNRRRRTIQMKMMMLRTS